MSSPRYSLATAASLGAGAGIVLATFAFAQTTATGIIFALSIVAGLGSLAAVRTAPTERPRAHRTLAGASVFTSAWTILVALGTFADREQYWIAFGGGVAITALSAAGRGIYHAAIARRAQAGPRAVPVAHAA